MRKCPGFCQTVHRATSVAPMELRSWSNETASVRLELDGVLMTQPETDTPATESDQARLPWTNHREMRPTHKTHIRQTLGREPCTVDRRNGP